MQVPGKILIAGEYSILDGGSALAVAVDRYLELQYCLEPAKTASNWIIQSELWPEPVSLPFPSDPKRHKEPLLNAAAQAQALLPYSSVSLRVNASLHPSYGLGSSSALRLAVLYGAACLATNNSKPKLSPIDWAKAVYESQKAEQSFGSGYDVLTQCLGGTLFWTPDYQNWPGPHCQSMSGDPLGNWLHVYVGGRGAPTREVGTSVRQYLKQSQQLADFAAEMQALVLHLREIWQETALKRNTLFPLLASLNKKMKTWPHFPLELWQELESWPGYGETWSAKTTGAGGEDALLVFAPLDLTLQMQARWKALGWHRLDLHSSAKGAQAEFLTTLSS